VEIALVLLALTFLMAAAYRGYSVILFAPVAALAAVALTAPSLVLPYFSAIFMERLAGFVKLYFPVFLLGAVFGKMIEVSGFAQAIIRSVVAAVGSSRAPLAIVAVCALLTYGGVSLFVVAFAVYPFAAELFRLAGIPKRLIPATIALGAFTFTMDALPGSPQIQNLIPTAFFGTNAWAAPWLGLSGAAFVLVFGLVYLEFRRRQAERAAEGYGRSSVEAPAAAAPLPHPLLAATPLLLVGVLNRLFTAWIPAAYGASVELPGRLKVDVASLTALWAVEAALAAAILALTAVSWRRLAVSFTSWTNAAIGGAMLAALNTGSEYGFGAVVAALPGFEAVRLWLAEVIRDPLLHVAVTTSVLAGITGSASGGMSIALAAMGSTFLAQAEAAGIPREVLHRVTAMASGGMDTLPHNGAVITLLLVTGLTHRESYPDIFVMTLIKTAAVFFVIGLYYAFGLR
jgi:H+/gluconate symporter-like permease